jgi:hypothetical protein
MTNLTPVLSAHWNDADSFTIAGYKRAGGYAAVTKALAMQPDEVIQMIKDSGLRGRGGAGFPTGMKWGFIPQGDNKEHYLVVNADESEPGTCKDMPLLLANPHVLVEGIIIASYAIRANHAFIYLRGEVVHVFRRVQQAIDDGIIIVSSAGNDSFYIDTKTGPDYNNKFRATYSGQAYLWDVHKGSAPGAASNVICVGAIGPFVNDSKASYSNTGPRISIFAPGTYIMSSLNNTLSSTYFAIDYRGGFHYDGKFSGTSMASPQVCGVLACALQLYPRMKQADALSYIQTTAKLGQITATSGGTSDLYDLQGAVNRYLYFKVDRSLSDTVFPTNNYFIRPSSGVLYPRPSRKIRFKQ